MFLFHIWVFVVDDFAFIVFLMKDYHPSRVLTLVYQPFAVGTTAILAYNEARIDTRWRIIGGFILYFISTLGCLLVGHLFLCQLYKFRFGIWSLQGEILLKFFAFV